MSQKPIRNRIRDQELNDFFDEHGTGSSTKPWQTAEWIEKREERLGDECKWCGKSDGELHLHHLDNPDVRWWRVWDCIRDQLFRDSDYYKPEKYNEGKDVCPECNRAGFYERETVTPKYRCNHGGHTFEEPGQRPTRETRQDAYWEDVDAFTVDNKESITEQFATEYHDHWEGYFELDNTVTVCKKCHYMYEKNGMGICAECEKEYGKYRPEMSEYVCWDCVVKKKGLKKCPECEEGWFDPQQNETCKNCRVRA